ncbi:MAG: hypothetical protein R3C53_27675 [Pirellulaceae bacterium]
MQIQVEPNVRTSYHRGMIESGLLLRLQQFIIDDLSPQLPAPVDLVDGNITPCYNEDRYCGPSSAVKDTYRLDIRFLAASEVLGTFKEEIEDDLRSHGFKARYRHRKLLVITQARRAAQEALGRAVQTLCYRIAHEQRTSASCPKCQNALNIIDGPRLFYVTCPSGCFTYDFHRDPKSGEFLHGHVFFGQPE